MSRIEKKKPEKKQNKKDTKKHNFRKKLLLNQWLISLFGIDPLIENQGERENKKIARPFHILSNPGRQTNSN